MIMTSSPELSIKFNQPRRTCILDPMLALSSFGIPLVKQLGTVMDLWVGKEFWHVLDNIQFYLQHPELLLLNRAVPDKTEYISSFSASQIIQSLQEWESFRPEIDMDLVKLFWVGDRLNESSLPKGIHPNIIQKYEFLSQSLDDRIQASPQTSETLTLLFSDTIALSASLSSSFILTHQYAAENNSLLPAICLELDSFGIPCQTVAMNDKMLMIEQEYLRKLFVQAGLSKFVWAGLKLNVLHIFVPSVLQSAGANEQNTNARLIKGSKVNKAEANPWAGTKCFLYQI
jgi:hypothetical protein